MLSFLCRCFLSKIPVKCTIPMEFFTENVYNRKKKFPKGGNTMQITTFAGIDIGSYEVGMKIFELSAKYGMK